MEKEKREQQTKASGDRRWYVVLAHQHREFLAKTNLERQGFEVYVPIMVRKDKRQKDMTVPFFPRVLFVRIDARAENWRPILSTFGVRAFLMIGDTPTPVPDDAISRLQEKEINGLLRIVPADEKPCEFKAGEAVKVVDLPLEGVFSEPVGERRVAMLVTFLGSTRRVAIDRKRLRQAS